MIISAFFQFRSLRVILNRLDLDITLGSLRMAGSDQGFVSRVQKYLILPGQCYRHCSSPTSFMQLLKEEERIAGAYVCPSGSVSRIVYFDTNSDVTSLKNLLSLHLVDIPIRDEEIRVATRHGWELGIDPVKMTEENRITFHGSEPVMQLYWAPPRHRTSHQTRGPSDAGTSAFLCTGNEEKEGCKRIFLEQTDSSVRLCPRCR